MAVDFKTDLPPFKFWCQQTLPAVYDDSLSYYDLLCKVVELLNTTMAAQNTLSEQVTNEINTFESGLTEQQEQFEQKITAQQNKYESDLTAAWSGYQNSLNAQWKQMQDWINHYFDNLDVQTEINNKLDEMAQSGSLSTLLTPLIDAWLSSHMTPTSPPLDTTFTLANAAGQSLEIGKSAVLNRTNMSGAIYPVPSTNLLADIKTPGLYYVAYTGNQLSANYTDTPSNWTPDTAVFLYVEAFSSDAFPDAFGARIMQTIYALNPKFGAHKRYVITGATGAWMYIPNVAENTISQSTYQISAKAVSDYTVVNRSNVDSAILTPPSSKLISDIKGDGVYCIAYSGGSLAENYTDAPANWRPDTAVFLRVETFNANVFPDTIGSRIVQSIYAMNPKFGEYKRYVLPTATGPWNITEQLPEQKITESQSPVSSSAINNAAYVNRSNNSGAIYPVPDSKLLRDITQTGTYLIAYNTADLFSNYNDIPQNFYSTTSVFLKVDYFNTDLFGDGLGARGTQTLFTLSPKEGSYSRFTFSTGGRYGEWYYSGNPLFGKRLSVIGDSLTYMNPAYGYNYVKYFQLFGSIIQDLGAGGTGFATPSNTYISRVPFINKPDMVCIQSSYNDILTQTPLGTAADTTDTTLGGKMNLFFEALVNAFPSVPVVGYSLSPSEEWHYSAGEEPMPLENYNNVFKDVCANWSVPYISLYKSSNLKPWIADNKAQYYRDNIHPNQKGHWLLYKKLKPFFDENIIGYLPVSIF